MRLALLTLTCALALPASAAENVMLVLDASGSMWGQIEGRSKVEIARETVAGVVRDWKAGDALGLVAYGHRRKGDCGDIETLVPVGPLDAASYLKTVDGLNALGMTPLSAAVQHAAAALKASERKATVILVSDGEETCELDPCAVGAELEKGGVDFTAHVIGFDVKEPKHQAQLRCLAENTGGRYFNARDAVELTASLQGAVSASVEPPPPPANATLAVGGPATIAQELEVTWSGPADRGDYIAFAPPGSADGAYLDYVRIEAVDGDGRGTVMVQAPSQAGPQELRYVSPTRRESVLARLTVEVADAQATLEAPEEVVAGTPVRVLARGPHAGRHWFGFAPKGSPATAYLAYARMDGPETTAELMPPAEPGDYELRFVLNENERVLASRPIRVVAAEAVVEGPDSAMAGDAVEVTARGPAGGGHWIGFAPAGSDVSAYLDYARPDGTTSRVVLTAPEAPGEYELRYVLNESEKIVASRPIRVTAAQATLQAPASVAAGEDIEVGFSGPRGGGWVGFVPRGGDGSEYAGYFSLAPGLASPQRLAAPREAGDYDLVYFAAERVLARQPVRVD
jgi:Ca-activated chloride channel family protein